MAGGDGTDYQALVDEMRTAGDCLRWAVSALNRSDVFLGHGNDDPRDEALALLLHVLALPWDSDPRLLEARLSRAERQAFADLLRRRIAGRVPVPYLTGIAWFAGLPFAVDERVLIPRSPLAAMIEDRFAPWLDTGRAGRVLELCTGSGCIAIALCHAFPEAEVHATDISADALAVAEANRLRHGCEMQLALHAGDLYAGVPGRFGLIVSNPPYVDAGDMATLPAEYRHEPALALAAGEDGLDLVVRILDGAAGRLDDGGLLVVEVGNSASALEALFPQVPFTWPDLPHDAGGVFLLGADDVRAHAARFAAEARRRAG